MKKGKNERLRGTPRLSKLTVISKSNSNQLTAQKSNPISYYLNIALILIIVFGVFGYVSLSNEIISNEYSSKNLKNQYNNANAEYESSSSRINSGYSMESLASYAKARGMIEAQDTIFVFDDVGVAIQNAYTH